MAGTNLSMNLIPEYNKVLREEPKVIAHYLSGISRQSTLQAGGFLLGHLK